MGCPETNTLAEYADGLLTAADVEATQRHLDECEDCRRVIGTLARSEAMHARGPEPQADPGLLAVLGDGRLLEPGSTLDRYVIIAVCGLGGMGVVYQAYDPSLDRRVAIKVLRTSSATSREHLQREARSLARLSHPNVVTIYEVGRLDDHDYLVLEFVQGETLATWCASRPWRRVLDGLLDAGRGLASAHGAGILHHDFKPGNVLVGTDDRIRVSDFGLARDRATRPSDLSGTPLYMAPERLAGAAADERSDQWSYAATAWEMLTGALPGREPGPRGQPPRRVLRVLQRALSSRPDDRFASMAELLDALERAQRRPRWPVVLAIVPVLAISAIVWSTRPSAFDRCEAAGATPVGAADRDAVQRRFVELAGDTGLGAASVANRQLEHYGAEWQALHHATCEARDAATLSVDLIDRRMLCLDRRRREVQAVLQLFETTRDREIAIHSTDAVTGMSRVGDCGDRGGTLRLYDLPQDRAQRAAIEAVTAELDRATPLLKTGLPREAVRIVRDAVAAADRAEHLPTRVDAAIHLANALLAADDFAGAVDVTRDGLELAARAGYDQGVAGLWIFRMAALIKLSRYDDALAVELPATTAIARVGGTEGNSLLGKLESLLGIVWMLKGEFAKGRGLLEKALALAEQDTDPQRELAVAGIRENLAQTRILAHDLDVAPAIEQLEQAVKIYEATLGANHPTVAASYSRLASVELLGHRSVQSPLDHLRRALAIQDATIGDAPGTAYTLVTLGGLLRGTGKLDEAWQDLERARRIFETTGGNSTALAALLQREALLRRAQGRHADDVELMRRALDYAIRAQGPASPAVSDFYQDVSESLLAQGNADGEAQEAADRAVAILHDAIGDDGLETASARVWSGTIAARRGAFELAKRSCTQALQLYRKQAPPPEDLAAAQLCLAEAELGLGNAARASELAQTAIGAGDAVRARYVSARALWASGSRARAIEMARAAQSLPDPLKGRDDRTRRELDAWVAAHAR